MIKTYILSFRSEKYTTKDISSEFDKMSFIDDWIFATPNTIIFKSPKSAKEISKMLEEKYGQHIHTVFEVSKSNFWGRLPKDYWSHV
jgi:hypothetical protein